MAESEKVVILNISDLANLYTMAKEMPGKMNWQEQLITKIEDILYPPPLKCKTSYYFEGKKCVSCSLIAAHPGKHRFEW